MQLLAGDLLHSRRHRPSRLLDLKLTEFDFVGPAQCLLALKIAKRFARLMPGRDQRQCADHERRQQEKVDAHDHVGAARSATRSVALRARGLAATSTSPARTARPTSFSAGCGSASLAMASLASRASPSNGRL